MAPPFLTLAQNFVENLPKARAIYHSFHDEITSGDRDLLARKTSKGRAHNKEVRLERKRNKAEGDKEGAEEPQGWREIMGESRTRRVRKVVHSKDHEGKEKGREMKREGKKGREGAGSRGGTSITYISEEDELEDKRKRGGSRAGTSRTHVSEVGGGREGEGSRGGGIRGGGSRGGGSNRGGSRGGDSRTHISERAGAGDQRERGGSSAGTSRTYVSERAGVEGGRERGDSRAGDSRAGNSRAWDSRARGSRAGGSRSGTIRTYVSEEEGDGEREMHGVEAEGEVRGGEFGGAEAERGEEGETYVPDIPGVTIHEDDEKDEEGNIGEGFNEAQDTDVGAAVDEPEDIGKQEAAGAEGAHKSEKTDEPEDTSKLEDGDKLETAEAKDTEKSEEANEPEETDKSEEATMPEETDISEEAKKPEAASEPKEASKPNDANELETVVSDTTSQHKGDDDPDLGVDVIDYASEGTSEPGNGSASPPEYQSCNSSKEAVVGQKKARRHKKK